MNDFWSANFWGIFGTGIASFSLLVSYLSFNYSRPKIRITSVALYARQLDYDYMQQHRDDGPHFFHDHSLHFRMDIRLANKKGGAGAISKPQMVIKIGPKHWFKKRDEIVIDPETREYRTTSTSDNSYSTETIDLGGSFNLTGGQILHGELEYRVRDEAMEKPAKSIQSAGYSIRYQTNSGKEKNCEVELTHTQY